MRPVFQGPEMPEFPGGDRNLDPRHLPESGIPTPFSQPIATPVTPDVAEIYGQYASSRRDGARQAQASAIKAGMPAPLVSVPASVKDFFRIPSKEEFKDALKIDATGLKQSGDEAAQSVAAGGKEAGDSIRQSASSLTEAGQQISSAIISAAQEIKSAAQSFNRGLAGQPAVRPPVNANLGRSMVPASPNSPQGGGGGGGF
jgi:hypothetical protein